MKTSTTRIQTTGTSLYVLLITAANFRYFATESRRKRDRCSRRTQKTMSESIDSDLTHRRHRDIALVKFRPLTVSPFPLVAFLLHRWTLAWKRNSDGYTPAKRLMQRLLDTTRNCSSLNVSGECRAWVPASPFLLCTPPVQARLPRFVRTRTGTRWNFHFGKRDATILYTFQRYRAQGWPMAAHHCMRNTAFLPRVMPRDCVMATAKLSKR